MAERPADVLLLYGPPWHGAAQFSKHHLARFLAARGHRVLYVEAPLGPLTLLKRRAVALPELRQTLRPPRAVAPNVWARRYLNPVPYHAVTRATAHPFANRLGQRLLLPWLRRDLRRLHIHRPIVVAGLPQALDLLPGVPRDLLVYHCADDYAHVRGFPASLPRLEEALCRQADLVVATAETLAQDRRRWNPNTHWIPNGVDVEHFAARVPPTDDPAMRANGPIVGFVGGLAQWVDFSLLRYLALERPNWTLSLIGPEGADLAPLRSLPNVRLLGPRPYAEVPRYLAAMDVALIPFTRDQVTFMADPIKAYEYLASGVPVVATDLPALRRLSHVIRLADTPEAFLTHVDAALATDRGAGAAERQAEARKHAWSSRFERFAALLAEARERRR